MATFNSNARVNLVISGKQAQAMLDDLIKRSKELEQDISKAAAAGDKVKLTKLNKELKEVNRQIKQLQPSVKSVEDTLKALDKATPKELSKTLNMLKRQLDGIQRGTKEWDEQIQKIKQVKSAIRDLNASMSPDDNSSFFEKINSFFNDFSGSIIAAAGAISGVVMAGKSAVKAYADMQQEMANVQKFTGMDEQQVIRLNEAFKQMDTRTGRAELNKLAQEAGRLGKQSQEDVLGFVRAADKINVALDDLGEGATLTLSKLTGVFGDEKKLGTEKALLSVGSVINELSQNCAASAPYIAEFASRMGGVGSQAGLTVQQIMAMAAVLDSNNQALEASATAVSQVMVRIYQDPAKYAKVAGMDVANFSRLVKEDMNSAFILFLETLSKAGNMDVLSPMFKDMGENGSRAISALSTLAGHIQEVKQQQQAANIAYEEATSIDKEFNVQNNTVQAGLEKAKSKFLEVAISLGEKLQPAMALCISGTSMLMKALSFIVNTFIQYKSSIFAAIAAIAAYKAATMAMTAATTTATIATRAFTLATAVWSKIGPAARLVLVALTNAISYFTHGLEVNYSMQMRWRNALAAMKFTSWIGMITALTTAIAFLAAKFSKAAQFINYASEAQKAANKIHEEAKAKIQEEISKVNLLVEAAKNETLTMDERRKAVAKLNAIIPGYNAQLDATTGKYRANEQALRSYLTALRQKYELEGAKSLLVDLGKQKAQAVIDAGKAKKDIKKAQEQQRKDRQQYSSVNSMEQQEFSQLGTSVDTSAENDARNRLMKANQALRQANETEALIFSNWGTALQREAATSNTTSGTGNTGSNNGGSTGAGGNAPSGNKRAAADNDKKDKFEEEKAWKEKEEAMLRISYATGQRDYLTYTKMMDDIAVEFYNRQLKHTDLSEQERLQITASWREAQLKASKDNSELTLKSENDKYANIKATIKQFYIDGKYSQETYQEASDRAEIEHLEAITKIYKEGSDEYIKASAELQDKLLEAQKRKQDKARQAQGKHQQELDKIKNEVFGLSPSERLSKYNEDLDNLNEVYQKEIVAASNNAEEKLRIEEAYQKAVKDLRKKYVIDNADDQKNSMQKVVGDSVEWLNSDGGKAFTESFAAISSGMSSIFSGLSTLVQSELEIQTAAIEKRYEKEISLAEGNTYKTKQLEKKKQAEIAKAKNEANRKMFAMQVIQAVAQTAQNAISAYGSAAAIPLVGYIIAPIAAGMAVAAGMIQIAAIKKQQQASESKGYASGGFTPAGRRNEPVGIVHAGEWVASQDLVNNPRTRPMLDILDYAQRTNTIASLQPSDVSRILTAPQNLTAALTALPIREIDISHRASRDEISQNNNMVNVMTNLDQALSLLHKRLSEPFITVNTVTGDMGIQRAQEEYAKLIRNKSAK